MNDETFDRDMLGPNPPMAKKWRPIINKLELQQFVVIPWREFVGRRPKTQEPKPFSDGKKTWLATPTESGMALKRIE